MIAEPNLSFAVVERRPGRNFAQISGSTGTAAENANPQRGAAFWEARRATIERAARAADPTNA